MAHSPSERSLQFFCKDDDTQLDSQSPPKTIVAHTPSELGLKSVCGDNSQFQSQPPQKTILAQPPSELSPQSACGNDSQMETQPQQKKIMAQSPSELISLKSVCGDHSQFETESPSERSQPSSYDADSQMETQPPQIKIVIHSPSEPSLQFQLESQPTQKTASPESVSLEDPQLERQQLESEWVIVEEKDVPGYYENTAEVPSPTSGDLPEEEAAVGSSTVLIDYSVPIDLTKMQRHNERSEHRRHSRKKNFCLCAIVVIVFFIALAIVSGCIYSLTVFHH